jgi:Fe2+ or Zn2+ uptake regulation protein
MSTGHQSMPMPQPTPEPIHRTGSAAGPALGRPGTPSSADSPDAITKLFRHHGLRRTRQRDLLYRQLASTDSHPTAEELFTRARRLDSRLSLATVYNTLETLHDAGLCIRVPCPTGAGPARYDACTTNHVHLAVEGSVLDVPDDLSRKLVNAIDPATLAEIERRTGISIDRLSIQIVGSRKTS